MKRENLSQFEGRIAGEGTVSRFGVSRYGENRLPTICIKDVVLYNDQQEAKVDHVWFRLNQKIKEINLTDGDRFRFTCVVKPYFKAPDYIEPQGYGIRKIRFEKFIEKGYGLSLFDFMEFKADQGSQLLHQNEKKNLC